ncbi:MAG: sigma-54 dependent transcriptional regulator [Pirellulales bacterium]|nr:sigma-54 dependent transcriptional regulator [Pirellulales bacterium]
MGGSQHSPPSPTALIIGASSWAERIREEVLQAAAHPSNVLITGPTGTGKELVARVLHQESDRSANPFIPADCAALPGDLFASQMFGHVKGAFTGAISASLGCFRAAHQGTIFLDEIGELDANMQSSLLRVIQERTVIPLGSHEPIPIDVRIVAATNRDLAREVREGRFREDLFYRLKVITLSTVPLAARTEDIPLLAEHYLAKLAIDNGLERKWLTTGAENLLKSHSWPGNVRQLFNVIERAVVYSKTESIGPEAMPELVEEVMSHPTSATTFAAPEPVSQETPIEREQDGYLHEGEQAFPTLAAIERKHILEALEQTSYNQSAAAELLGISYKVLARKVRQHDIDVSRSRRGRPSRQSRARPR